MLLTAEIHCHVEGAADPELVVRQAHKYGKDTTPYIRDGSFVWHDFTSFLQTYDFAADLFRTEDDYALLTEHYLTSLARDGAIYSEVFTSPDHARKAGLSAEAYTNALGEGMVRARDKTGIERRMIVTGVRHFGVESVESAARFAAKCGHPLVTGFGMAGEERFGDMEDYVRAFEIAREAGLGITVHAGELAGWESVAPRSIISDRAASGMACAPSRTPIWSSGSPTRASSSNAARVERCAEGVRQLRRPSVPGAACRRMQGDIEFRRSAIFLDSLKNEYDLAAKHFGMSEKALTGITRTAIEAAYVDRKTKSALLARLDKQVAVKTGENTPAVVSRRFVPRASTASIFRSQSRKVLS